MKTSFSVAIVGFPDEDVKVLKKIVMGAQLGLEVILTTGPRPESDFSWDFDQEIDCLLLSTIGHRNSVSEIIFQVKQRSPLTEVVLITYSENYNLAIGALREGVRDILNYPVNARQLQQVLSKVKHYLDLGKRSESFSSLLELYGYFGHYKVNEEEDKFFLRLYRYLKIHFEVPELTIISMGNSGTGDKTKKIRQGYRLSWSSGRDRKVFSPSLIMGILRGKALKEILEDKNLYILKEDKNKCVIVLNLGKVKAQRMMGLFKVDLRHSDKLRGILPVISGLLFSSFRQIVVSKEEKRLSSLVYTDDVTGLYNQRKFSLDLDRCIEKYKKVKDEFAILFIDVDHFKQVNDGHGHRIGSLLLIEMAKLFKKMLRETDLIYRYGGDEFVIIIPKSQEVPGLPQKIGERILSTFKKHVFHPDTERGKEFQLSVSIGISQYPQDATTKNQIFELADDMMYLAKRTGRGRVCFMSNNKGQKKTSLTTVAKAKPVKKGKTEGKASKKTKVSKTLKRKKAA